MAEHVKLEVGYRVFLTIEPEHGQIALDYADGSQRVVAYPSRQQLRHAVVALQSLMPALDGEGDLGEIVVTGEFTDDHLPCVSFTWGGRHLSLWWTDSKTIGALHFWQAPEAQLHLRDLLKAIDGASDADLEDGVDTDSGNVQFYKEGDHD